MQVLYKLARPTLLLSGVMVCGYVTMKVVTPTPQDLLKVCLDRVIYPSIPSIMLNNRVSVF